MAQNGIDMRARRLAMVGIGVLAAGLLSGCGSSATTAESGESTARATAPASTTKSAADFLSGDDDTKFEWALNQVDAKHPGGAESIRLGRGVCQQFDKVQSYTYGALWLVKNSDGFYTKADQVSGIVAAAIAIYCPENKVALTDDPGLTVGRDGKVSVDTGDNISDLVPD